MIHPNRAGIALGAVLGAWHLLWAAVVALGYAPALLNFVLRLHFLQISYKVFAFNAVTALTLVVATAIMGYAMGYVFALIWNKIRE